MSFVDIDFASRRRIPLWFALGAAAAAGALAWGAYRYAQAQGAVSQAQTQIEQQRREQARAAAAPVVLAPAPPKERVKAINQAIWALNVPWPALLGAIESARPASVALMRVEPRPQDGLVLVTAQADDMAALLDFMAVVSRTAPFVKSQPVRQENVVEAGMPRRQATFEARWEIAP